MVAESLGVRGTIAEIVGDEATVLGRGGLRVRVPLDRLVPDRDASRDAGPAEPAVTVRAMVQNDLPDEIDLRGRTAQEAREAVRDLIDQAALAGPGRGARDPRPRHRRGAEGRARRGRQAPARRGTGVGLGGRGDGRAARPVAEALATAEAGRSTGFSRSPGLRPLPHVGAAARVLPSPPRTTPSERERGGLIRCRGCLVGDLGSARRQHDEREPGVARIRLARDEADPLERRELARDTRGGHGEPPRELDAPERLGRGGLQLEQHREIVETETMVAAERVVDVPHDQRAGAREVERKLEIRPVR